jgi:nucleoside-diphosphate-sugar epimerase
MRVAITGASGAIGSYVVRELLAFGHDVVAVGRTPPAVEHVGYGRASLDDAGALERAFAAAEAVVHLAAITSPYRAPVQQLMDVNVIGTVRVLDAAVVAGVPKLVFASSGAATGFSFQPTDRAPRYLPLDEDHPCEPADTYGISKLVGELLCERWSDAHPLATISLRINNNWYVDRPGAEAALRGGWAKGLAVEDVWQRYRLQLEQSERPRSPTAPPLPRDLLWAVTDARDAAQAFRLAVEDGSVDHGFFHVNGSDTCSFSPSEELVGEWFPYVPLREPLPGHATLVSHSRATDVLGYRPQHTWRESDFATWLEARAG